MVWGDWTQCNQTCGAVSSMSRSSGSSSSGSSSSGSSSSTQRTYTQVTAAAPGRCRCCPTRPTAGCPVQTTLRCKPGGPWPAHHLPHLPPQLSLSLSFSRILSCQVACTITRSFAITHSCNEAPCVEVVCVTEWSAWQARNTCNTQNCVVTVPLVEDPIVVTVPLVEDPIAQSCIVL